MLEKSIFSLIMTFWDMTKLPFRKLDLYTVQVSQCYYQMRPSELIRDEIAMVT